MLPVTSIMNKPVREWTANFPDTISRLEEKVVSITKKDFSIITCLGALLGGIIGLFKGFVTVLIG
ncbi:DUF445 family protein [Peribacillus simplex]